MMELTKTVESLKSLGYGVTVFDTKGEAADYLVSALSGREIGIGGSMTVEELGIFERLSENNKVFWHWHCDSVPQTRALASKAEVYIMSANGVAETGEIVNIDGNGNRVAGMLFGHKKVYIIIGANKIAPDLEAAQWRARNIASPKNAMRLGVKTPCAEKGDRCYDCRSPQRICGAEVVLWKKPSGIPDIEVVIVNEPLGY